MFVDNLCRYRSACSNLIYALCECRERIPSLQHRHLPVQSFVGQDIDARLIWDLRRGACPISCKRGGAGNCTLFARKFPQETEPYVLKLAEMILRSDVAVVGASTYACPTQTG